MTNPCTTRRVISDVIQLSLVLNTPIEPTTVQAISGTPKIILKNTLGCVKLFLYLGKNERIYLM